jgi:hypothetical protein
LSQATSSLAAAFHCEAGCSGSQCPLARRGRIHLLFTFDNGGWLARGLLPICAWNRCESK